MSNKSYHHHDVLRRYKKACVMATDMGMEIKTTDESTQLTMGEKVRNFRDIDALYEYLSICADMAQFAVELYKKNNPTNEGKP